MYAIIDIETTGGNHQRDKITEIAVYVHDGSKVIDEFTTLINPERSIPYYITQMTGITDDMVANAPRFFEIARKIVELTVGKVFVAHNAPFDYRFIQSEFKQLGYEFERETICTVRLSRKLIPGKSSYSLGNLCNDLGIRITDRHRAAGDALATVKLLELLLSINRQSDFDALSPIPDRKGLHPDLNLPLILKIPEDTGVYYLYDDRGVLIYVGKSVNIRHRVQQHLGAAKTIRAGEMRSRIADISYEVTGSELIALLVETEEIKKSKPLFNRAGRRSGNQLGMYHYENEHGYICLNIKRMTPIDGVPLTTFANADESRIFLDRLMEKYNLCQTLCNLYTSGEACFHYEIKRCFGACIGEESADKYNIRVQKAIDSIGLSTKNFLLFDKGRNNTEKSVVKVVNGKLIGYGFFDPNSIDGNISLLDDILIPCSNNRDAHQIIKSFLIKAKPGSVIYLNAESPED
ncbi:MAG: exonuclease [Bacteroidales bacterium]|nr:MAG: exonuclease [Bacteroidales bacterium]